jgi:hypothetical protein
MAEPRTGPQTPPSGNRWHWLLVISVVVPLLVFLYNGRDPRLFGFPRFYWLQLAFILLGVGTTVLVYRLTQAPRLASAPAAVPPSGPPPAAPSASPAGPVSEAADAPAAPDQEG